MLLFIKSMLTFGMPCQWSIIYSEFIYYRRKEYIIFPEREGYHWKTTVLLKDWLNG